MAHLTVLPFDERELDPTSGNVCAESYWRVARPKPIGFFGNFGLAGLGMVTLDVYAFSEFADSLFGDLAVYLREVCTRVLVFRVEQFLDEFPVIGQ